MAHGLGAPKPRPAHTAHGLPFTSTRRPAHVAQLSHRMPTPAQAAHFFLSSTIASLVAPVSASLSVTFTSTSSTSAPLSLARLSYSARLTSSLSTSYAVTIRRNRRSASGFAAASRTLSGWHFSTSLRYALRTVSPDAVGSTPSVEYRLSPSAGGALAILAERGRDGRETGAARRALAAKTSRGSNASRHCPLARLTARATSVHPRVRFSSSVLSARPPRPPRWGSSRRPRRLRSRSPSSSSWPR